ncbi:hypothetical protein ACGF0D_10645 [Kitasatospora sp. NPDC048298]|uniref:hypothetical protein n=1 Tax=Kitasatospora sp. NPDC048298 TaxID=3364049 RepID=UPI003716E1D3
MGLWSTLIGGKTANPPTASRTPRERARRAAEIRKIDTGTAAWLRAGGRGPRKDH